MKERQKAMRTLACCGCDLPLGRRRARATRWHAFAQLVFSDLRAETHVLAPSSSTRDWRPEVQQGALPQRRRTDEHCAVLRRKFVDGTVAGALSAEEKFTR